MTKPVLFLDNDFISNIYGEVSGQGDANRLIRALDALYQDYDIRVTDEVFEEAVTPNIDPLTGQRYAKDVAVENWLSEKSLSPIATSVTPGTNAGERSIIYAIQNPGSDPILSDSGIPKY